jgi:hypothetical protein
MNRQLDINALLNRADKLLPKMENDYNNSLHAKSVSADLKIDIKDFVGHLRSALDYLAHDIRDEFCPTANKNDDLYFPIRGDRTKFDNYINRAYPGLNSNCPDLYSYLEKIQPYHGSSTVWLSHFNDLNNENKHEKLVEQKRTETRTVKVSSNQGGGSVSWGPGVTFGSGVSVMGVPIDPRTQMPVPNNITTTEVTIWVDFRFDNIDVSALWLLKESLTKIKEIVTSVTQWVK